MGGGSVEGAAYNFVHKGLNKRHAICIKARD